MYTPSPSWRHHVSYDSVTEPMTSFCSMTTDGDFYRGRSFATASCPSTTGRSPSPIATLVELAEETLREASPRQSAHAAWKEVWRAQSRPLQRSASARFPYEMSTFSGGTSALPCTPRGTPRPTARSPAPTTPRQSWNTATPRTASSTLSGHLQRQPSSKDVVHQAAPPLPYRGVAGGPRGVAFGPESVASYRGPHTFGRSEVREYDDESTVSIAKPLSQSLTRDLDWFMLKLSLREMSTTVSQLGHRCSSVDSTHVGEVLSEDACSLSSEDICSSVGPSVSQRGYPVSQPAPQPGQHRQETEAEIVEHHASQVWHMRRCSWPKTTLGLEDGLYILPAGDASLEVNMEAGDSLSRDWRVDVQTPSIASRTQVASPYYHRRPQHRGPRVASCKIHCSCCCGCGSSKPGSFRCAVSKSQCSRRARRQRTQCPTVWGRW